MNRIAQGGVTLIELMVAMVIGLLLIAGALSVFAQSRSVGRVNETVARIQEQGRYALSVIESDIELAGFYGFTNRPEVIRFIASGNASAPLATSTQMSQSAPALGALPADAHACGRNFAIDLRAPVQGSEASFELGIGATGSCDAYGAGAVADSDTITVRRVETREAVLQAGRLQVYGSRMSSHAGHFLIADGVPPGPLDGDHRVRNLVVRSYYVSQDSVSRAGFPALRAKSLSSRAGRIVFDEDEVMTGIEDLQVQFGIDSGDRDNDGVIDEGADLNGDGTPEAGGRVTRYVSADFPDLARFPVMAVRLWLRVRADEPEPGFDDSRVYSYAGVTYSAEGQDRAYRRALLSRTIAVRNARRS